MQGQLLHFSTFGEENSAKNSRIGTGAVRGFASAHGGQVRRSPWGEGHREKTAPKLMRKFGSLDNLLASVEEVAEKRYREALQNSHEIVLLSRELVQLKRDVPHGVPLQDLVLKPPLDGGCSGSLRRHWRWIRCAWAAAAPRSRELWRSLRKQGTPTLNTLHPKP